MSAPGRIAVGIVLTVAVGLGAVASGDTARTAVTGSALFAIPDALDDPFPIARIRATDEQLAAALKSTDYGPLVRLPRSEFEARVQAAAKNIANERLQPKLVEASYTATLAGSDLVGDAQWSIVNPRSQPAFLALDPSKIAVQTPTWADGSEAIVGLFGPGFATSPGVWVPPGRQTLKFKWSSIGVGFAGELQFPLQVPPCSTTALELELPTERVPTLPANAMLTGPFPIANDPNRRTWRFRFGDRAPVEFGIRSTSNPGSTVFVASLVAKCDVTPTEVTSTFEYELRSSRGSQSDWAFQLSPGFAVADVVVNDRSSWRVDAATRVLHVVLRQPSSGAKFIVSGTSPLPASGRTQELPRIRPVNAVGTGERWELRIAPTLELEALEASDYRVVESSLAADGARLATLVGTLLPAERAVPDRRSPAIRLSASDADFTTTEALDWRIESGRIHLSARVGVRVRRGPLFRLNVRTPPGFTLDRLANSPDDAVSYSGLTASGLEVEFERPLDSGQRVELRIELRGPAVPSQDARFEFPRFAPSGAAERDGWLSLTPDAASAIHPMPAAGMRSLAKAERPEGVHSDAAFVYAFRGTEPNGSLAVVPVKPEFSASTETQLSGGGAQVTATTRIDLKVSSGQLTSLAAFEPGPPSTRRVWKLADATNAIVATTAVDSRSLPSMGTVLSRLASGAALTDGTYWIVQFARPLTGEVSLESTALVPRESADRSPLQVLGAVSVQAKTGGSTPAVATTPVAVRPGVWTFDGLHLITVATESHALVVFGGTLRTPAEPMLRIAMPAGAEVRAACVAGYWLDPGRCQLTSAGEASELRLPIPAASGSVRFEVRYRMPAPPRSLGWVNSPEPALPGEGHSIARWWALPGDAAAVWPLSLRDRASAGDWPVLLGEALPNSFGELAASRASAESVFLVPVRLLNLFGAVLAALLAAVSWFGAQRANRFVGMLLLLLLIAFGAAYWLGPGAWERAAFAPLVASLLGAVAVIGSAGWPTTARIPARTGTAAIVLALLAITIPAIAARAEPVASREVAFILAGSEPSREIVVVPRSTLDRLDSLRKRLEPFLVIGSATYNGRLEDGLTRFDARFVVHAFRDGETLLELPLADVRLERANLDGKPTLPILSRPDVYAIPVLGRGRHTIDLRFAVPLTQTGPEREVRFGVPEVPDSRLSFTAPATARQLQVVGRSGELKTTDGKDRVQLEAGLGGIRSVQLRWREGTGGGAATVRVREGCIWDVSERGHELTACYQVQIESGSAASLRFDIPPGLEPTRVAVRSLDSLIGANLLRDWSLGKEGAGLRPLRIDLSGPTEGRLLVTLECTPSEVPRRVPVLRFPQPIGMKRTDAIYGLRASGVTLESIGRAGVIDFAADVLAHDFGSVPELRLNAAVPVVAFSPRSGEVAELTPVLRRGSELPVVSQDVSWNVDARQTTGQGSLKWAASEPVSSIEFHLPATITEVRAPDLASWAQTDGRVQVWFRKPMKDGRLDWLGTLPGIQPGPGSFEPPIPSLANAKVASLLVRIRPEEGWGVRIERDKGWTAVLTNDRVWTFQSEGSQAPPRLQLFAPANGRTRGFGSIEIAGSEAIYRTIFAADVPANRPLHFVLQARGLPKAINATLDVPLGTLVHEGDGDEGSREWDLDVPASAGTGFHCSLVVKFPAKGSHKLPVLDLRTGGTIPAAHGIVRWIGLSGGARQARLEGAVPASSADRAMLQTQWPGETERLRRTGGSTWSVPTGTATLQFETAPAPPAKAPATPSKPESVEVAQASSAAPETRILAALAWCGTAFGVLMLFARSPRFTWPEQVGLLGGLFGFAVAGGWAVGIGVYAAARLAWLVGLVFSRR